MRLQALLALADLPPSTAAGKAVAQFLARSREYRRPLAGRCRHVCRRRECDRFPRGHGGRIKTPSPQLLERCKIVANHFARSEPGQVRPNDVARSPRPTRARRVRSSLASSEAGQPGSTLPNDEACPRTPSKQLLERLRLDDQVHLARLAPRGAAIQEMQASSRRAHGRSW